MIQANDLSTGMVLKLDGHLCQVLSCQTHGSGKSAAKLYCKLRRVWDGSVTEKTFRTDDKVEDIDLERRDMEYLYDSGTGYVFMDDQDYDQKEVGKEMIGTDMSYFLQENQKYPIYFHDGSPVTVKFPESIYCEVTFTAPPTGAESSVLKEAELKNGLTIHVPQFINSGDIIKIDTGSKKYMERVKK